MDTPRVSGLLGDVLPPTKHSRLRSTLRWLWFEFRASVLRLERAVWNWIDKPPSPPPAAPDFRPQDWATVLGESVSPLRPAQSQAEVRLVAGKVHNLMMAAALLNGTVVPAGEIFSFWSVVGRPTRGRGFVEGRELREGCLVASVGGGLCQLSNALHLAALEAGFTIVERHAHSKAVPGSIAATGRDATVFWNYKDLRFLASLPFALEVRLTATELIVRLRAESAAAETAEAPPEIEESPELLPAEEPAEDCVTCRQSACVYHPGAQPA